MPITLTPGNILRYGLVLLLLTRFSDLYLLFNLKFSAFFFLGFSICLLVLLFLRVPEVPILAGILLFAIDGRWLPVAETYSGSHHHLVVLSFALFCLAFEKSENLFRRSLGLLIFTVYGAGALRKLHPEFLSGMRVEQILREIYWGSELVLSKVQILGLQALAIMTVAVELALMVYPFVAKAYQRWLLISAVIFHSLLAIVVPVSIFSPLMILILFVLYCLPKNSRQFTSDKTSCLISFFSTRW